jgi:hemoglobin
MKSEINSITEIKRLVDTFYEKVREDDLLAPIFNAIIQNNWPTHLEKMYRFWQTVLLHEYTYKGAPFLPHAKMPLEKVHFKRWLKLFNETLDENFEGEIAEDARKRANKMAEMFQLKIEIYRNDNSKSLL